MISGRVPPGEGRSATILLLILDTLLELSVAALDVLGARRIGTR